MNILDVVNDNVLVDPIEGDETTKSGSLMHYKLIERV